MVTISIRVFTKRSCYEKPTATTNANGKNMKQTTKNYKKPKTKNVKKREKKEANYDLCSRRCRC